MTMSSIATIVLSVGTKMTSAFPTRSCTTAGTSDDFGPALQRMVMLTLIAAFFIK